MTCLNFKVTQIHSCIRDGGAREIYLATDTGRYSGFGRLLQYKKDISTTMPARLSVCLCLYVCGLVSSPEVLAESYKTR